MLSSREFPGASVFRKPPSNEEDSDSIPGQGTKIPHVAEQLLSPHTATMTTKDPACHNQDPRQPNKYINIYFLMLFKVGRTVAFFLTLP